MTFREKCFLFFATGGFVGNIPFAPGTFGSLWGILCYGLVFQLSLWIILLIIFLLIVIAIWIAHESEKIINKRDPGSIVIDEITGMMVTLIGLPYDISILVAGFIVFRIIDILKPFPIRRIETSFPGGVGIVLDDIAAGIISNALIRSVIAIYNLRPTA